MKSLRSTPEVCLCCHKPLTLTKKIITRVTPAHPHGEQVLEESWDCTDEECVAYRKRLPRIPTPPLSK